MEDSLTSALSRLGSLASSLGATPGPDALEQLQSAAQAALAVLRGQGQLGAVQQKRLWEAASLCWNASIDLAAGGQPEAAGEAGGAADVCTALLQAACDLCSQLPAGGLAQTNDVVNLIRFYVKAGQAWTAQGRLEAAEAALSRGAEAAAAHGLQALCFNRAARGPIHQDAAEMTFQLLLGRLRAGLRLDQQVLTAGVIKQAQAFVADARLPPGEGVAFKMRFIRELLEQGETLAKAGHASAAAPMLNTAYECLSQIEPEGDAEDAELAGVVAEAQALGASVLALLTFCTVEAGDPEQAMACLQALRQVAGPQQAASFPTTFLSLSVLLKLGRLGEAETELLNLVSHADATPEGCLSALQAVLATPGGVPLASSALSLVLEHFGEEPGVAVELVRAALAAVSKPADADPTCQPGAAAEGLALELVADERLLEGVCEEAGLRRTLLGLLWNHAVAAMHCGSAFASALAFFSAALPLLGQGSSSSDDGTQMAGMEGSGTGSKAEGPTVADCHRAQALCCLGLRQYDRALEFLSSADAAEPSQVATAMLRLSVHLGAGSGAGAVAAVAALAERCASQPDALRIACVQAVDAGAVWAARQALLCLLDRCAACTADRSQEGPGEGSSPLHTPGYESVVFQNLIQLYLAESNGNDSNSASGDAMEEDSPQPAGSDSDGQTMAVDRQVHAGASSHYAELAGVFDRVVQRMQAVGPAAFFVQQDSRAAQQEWFSVQAWNAGQLAGAQGNLQHAAVLLAVCGELCAAMPAATVPLLHRRKMAFLLAATCACDVHAELAAAERTAVGAAEEQGLPPPAHAPGTSSASSLNLARQYLHQARAAADALVREQAAMAGGEQGGQQGGDPKSDVYLLLLDFQLCWLAGDTAGQVQALERAQALPAFGAEHYARAASFAHRPSPAGNQPSPEARRMALAGRLRCLTGQVPMDGAAVAQTLRSLIELAQSDADKLRLYRDACGLLSSAGSAAFPEQETRWLVHTCWNRGATLHRLGRHLDAEPMLACAWDMLRHAGGALGEGYNTSEMRRNLDDVRRMLGMEAVEP